MFPTILIANRGEIAVRIMRTCAVMGIRTVAVYRAGDEAHIRTADAAAKIDSYLNGDAIITAAQSHRAAAIHPGYGFLAENATFAQAVRDAALTFIGPPTDAIAQMGSKTRAREIMQAAGVPIVPGYDADEQDIDYPILVKAAAGGGGKGMRIVESAAELDDAIISAKREAQNAFGDATIFLEKYIPNAHHIEFQILADTHGNTLHLFERECSIQRRHQKIIEETPSPLLNDNLRQRMAEAAVAAAQAVDYVNAGTIEFMTDENGNFYFLEMNTRLQVEHPITEMVTGLDLVALQLQIAAGEPIPFSQGDVQQRGHAIECRIYAEDPARDFLPDAGDILLAQMPHLPNVRLDTSIQTGDTIETFYDPMIAKLVTVGHDRLSALQTMQAALEQYIVLGLTTNIPFLLDVMRHPAFIAGETTTRFVDQHFAGWQPELPPELIIAAALMDASAMPTPSGIVADTGDAFSPWNQADGFRL